jgi:hypothetical protein
MIELIEKYICEQEKIDPVLLHSKSRKTELKEARQMIMVLAREKNYTLTMAGKYFCRDHCTVLNAEKIISNLCATDKYFNEKFERYKRELDDVNGLKKECEVLNNELRKLENDAMSMEFRISNIRQRLNELKSKV